jgi:hypothetical protein
MDNAIYSTMIRSGNTTYFVDAKEAKNGKKYLVVTENRINEHYEKSRSTVKVFSETAPMLLQAITEAEQAMR